MNITAAANVTIVPTKADPKRYAVTPMFDGVDLPHGRPMVVEGMDRALRLADAMTSGAAFHSLQVVTSTNDLTHVESVLNVRVKTLDADLQRLGC